MTLTPTNRHSCGLRDQAANPHFRWHRTFATRSAPAPASALGVAAAAVLSGRMHARAGVPLAPLEHSIALGDVVVVRLWGMRAPCLITELTRTDTTFSLTYATLPGHPECGEEQFALEFTPWVSGSPRSTGATASTGAAPVAGATGVLTARVCAYSHAASPLTRLGGPVARVAQQLFAGRYAEALLAEAGVG